MAERTIKNKIVVEGEAQYKKAMADIGRTLKEVKSAAKAATAEYKSNGDSMVAAYRCGDALESVYNAQSTALSTMENHLDAVTSALGRDSREAIGLRTKINNMRAEMARTDGQIKDFQKGLDASTAAAENTGDAVQDTARDLAAIGAAAGKAGADVGGLKTKLGDLTLGGLIGADFAKDMALKAAEAIKNGVVWGWGEGVDGIKDENMVTAITGTTGEDRDMLVRVMDDLKRKHPLITDDEAYAAAAAGWTSMTENGVAPSEEELTSIVPVAYGISKANGSDVTTTLREANVLVDVFKTDWMHALDLIDTGMKSTAGQTGQLMQVVGQYGNSFAQLGMDADEMFAVFGTATEVFGVDKLGDIGRAVQTFQLNLASGTDSVTTALTDLGIEATDLPAKIAQGGETAAAGYQLVLDKLLAVQDDKKRQELSGALFGDKNFLKTGGNLAEILLGSYGKQYAQEGLATQTSGAVSDNLESNAAGLKERAGQYVGGMTQPLAEGANDALKVINKNIDDAEGDIVEGTVETLKQANHNVGQAAADFYTETTEKYDAFSRNVAVKAADFIGGLFGGKDDTQKAADEQKTAVTGGLDAISSAAASSDAPGRIRAAVTAEGERDAIEAGMDELGMQVISGYDEAARGGVEAVGEQEPEMAAVADKVALSAVKAIRDRDGDMEAAGDRTGAAGVSGMETGLAPSYAAAAQGAHQAVEGFRSGIGSSYAAGYDAGAAYWQGVNDGLTDKKAAGFSAALGGWQGTGGGESPAGGGAALDDSAIEGAVERGVRAGFDGVGVQMDGHEVGRAAAPSVSRQVARSGSSTIVGRSSRVKGW